MGLRVGFTATNAERRWWQDKDAGIKVISNNNTIKGNNASSNEKGISLSFSSSNIITDNTLSNNNDDCIDLGTSSNNTITGNTFVNDGLFVYSPYQNTVENNTVNGKPLVYLEDVSDYKVEDAGQVIIVNCNNITVENIDLSNTSVGIELWRTENSKVLNNTVSNNSGNGIILSHSCNNTITGNNVNNNVDGIYL
jgi:parallel beta-helix repeat protein